MAHGGDIYGNKIKLDFSVNTNPLGAPESVLRRITERIRACELYPDREARELVSKLSAVLGGANVNISPENIVLGNGASELLMAVVHAISPKKILIPVPSFTGYEYAAATSEAQLEFYCMKEADGFELTEEFLEHITPETDLIFLANPNNPTGKYVGSGLLRRIVDRCEKCKATLLTDECFMELSDAPREGSLIRALMEYPHLLILRSFTKSFALAGLRLGYLLGGNVDKISEVKRHLPEWNVSSLAQTAGIAALDETEELKKARRLINEERDFLQNELSRLGFSYIASSANYILFKENPKRGIRLYEELLKIEILIRDCADYRGLGAGWYRIAVRTEKENKILAAAVHEIVKER